MPGEPRPRPGDGALRPGPHRPAATRPGRDRRRLPRRPGDARRRPGQRRRGTAPASGPRRPDLVPPRRSRHPPLAPARGDALGPPAYLARRRPPGRAPVDALARPDHRNAGDRLRRLGFLQERGRRPPARHEQHGHAHRHGRERGVRLQPDCVRGLSPRVVAQPARVILHGSDRPARADQLGPLARGPRPPIGRLGHPRVAESRAGGGAAAPFCGRVRRSSRR